MRYFFLILLCLMVSSLTACANKAQQRQRNQERAAADMQAATADMNQRLAALEQRLATMSSEMSVLKHQPYAVKTTKGAKTNYVASAPSMPAPPPVSPDPYAADASAPMFAPATAPITPSQGDGWLSSYAPPPPPSPSRGTGAKAVPAPAVRGPRTLIPQEQPQAAQAAQPRRQAGANEFALPPETPTGAPQQAAMTPPAAPAPAAPQAASAPAPRGGRQTAPAPAPAVGQGEDALYNKALAEFNASRYAQAAAGFTELMHSYPTGRYAPNAGYWLGEALYGQNLYSDALAQFKEVTSRFPQHHKAPDALFKAGLCYTRLGDKDNAAAQFRALATDYPNSPAAGLARQRGFVR